MKFRPISKVMSAFNFYKENNVKEGKNRSQNKKKRDILSVL